MTITTSHLGQVKVEGELATLTFERHLVHPPEAVWKAITEPEELSKWYGAEVQIDGRVGGSVHFARRHGTVTGSILAWDPPRVFEHEWKVERSGSPKMENGVIRWELESEGEGTLLTLIHRNMPTQIARLFAPGVHAALDSLEAYLEGAPLPDFAKRVEELGRSYAM